MFAHSWTLKIEAIFQNKVYKTRTFVQLVKLGGGGDAR